MWKWKLLIIHMCRWKSFGQKAEKLTWRLGDVQISNSNKWNGVLEGKECARRSGCRGRQMTMQKPLIPQMPGGSRKSSKGFNQENEVIPCAPSTLNWKRPFLCTLASAHSERKTLLLATNLYLQEIYRLLEKFQCNTSSLEPTVFF